MPVNGRDAVAGRLVGAGELGAGELAVGWRLAAGRLARETLDGAAPAELGRTADADVAADDGKLLVGTELVDRRLDGDAVQPASSSTAIETGPISRRITAKTARPAS